ncbi:putative signal transducing protein [Lacipirellula parvula]|uniref:DUF2007 domain-containing protein n=1 Tax=Lacipirellula parvula TaxID=2650471 RepID=A0A5K7X9H6_9BACT|nr:DUF2007 domain-containing protein [Lacipirellula parvula]BBO33025.1 hypothetical protein PLANPX_2637 [Lacipirellula parvula]
MIQTSAPNLVTVASFGSVTEAEIAQQCLAAAGIESYLVDAAMVGTMWHLGVAMGGVKLQVAETDALEAAELLTEARAGRLEFEFDDSSAAESETEMQREALSEREALANRAFKATFFSMLLEPLAFYAAWLLLRVAVAEGPLRQPYRGRAIAAAVLCPLIVGFAATLLWFFVTGSSF